jgi:hypothetical protein
LAVAFGDGLAFGVGMTLTQTAAKSTAIAPAGPQPNLGPLVERLTQLEARLQQMERTPLPSAVERIDQQVLEAVVQAVETRLKEQNAQMAVELKSVHENLRNLSGAAEARMRELQAEFAHETAAIRQEFRENGAEKLQQAMAARLAAVDESLRAEQDRARTEMREFMERFEALAAALRNEVAATVEAESAVSERRVLEQVAQITTAVRAEIAAAMEAQSAGTEQTIETALDRRLPTVQAALEAEIGGLRSELAQKDAELDQVRQIARRSEQYVHGMLLTIGQMCTEAAERMAPAAAAEPPASQAEMAVEPEPAASPEEPAEAVTENPHGEPVPIFSQAQKPGRVWRIPLVSSLLLGGLGAALLQYI